MTEIQPYSWWADAGPDACDFCQVTYHIEVGYHCAICDRPICPSCAVTVFERRTVVCPECDETNGEN